MKRPLISVIVPIYNAEQYIDKCIQSILNQDFKDFDLILVNDGSTDNSGSICESYQKKDSRVIVVHKENGGECSARNEGLKFAKSEWIAFSDADDWMDSNWLSIFVDNIQENVDLIIQGFDYSYNRDFLDFKHEGINFQGQSKDGLVLLFKAGITGYNWCKLFRREIIQRYNIRFDEKLKFRGDEDFVLCYIIHSTNMISVDCGTYKYIMPDWKSKYKIDNFYCNKKCFQYINELYNKEDEIFVNYLTQLCNSYFESFNFQLDNLQKRTEQFQKVISGFEDYLPTSKITRFILKYLKSHKIVTFLFYLKNNSKK